MKDQIQLNLFILALGFTVGLTYTYLTHDSSPKQQQLHVSHELNDS